ncbi:MAG: putative transcriptional regulatory protein [Microgenomates group bacterium ADurb.Bin219]|nr:MAG: putative transcriptional regulatory protein [Microgenomates group bacterium ADurb.Bin219]HNP89732.1 YebC/PmpR family DNA-binding transcriptional regulator [Candidatus Woesebacteria bacterium]
MSGHSKWATIHRAKEVTDQKRGQAFTKITNSIIIAVKEANGITDPNSNFKLRLALDKAREVNMPKDNVQRAIDRASGASGAGTIDEMVYEGYGPGGVAILVEAATDNRQRTVQEIKNIFDRAGGSLGSPGAVSFLFKKLGLILVNKGANAEETTLKLIDLGAEDVEEVEDGIEVYVAVEIFEEMKKKISEAGLVVIKSELVSKPTTLVPVAEAKAAAKILNLMEKLDSHDDVLKVYANFDIPEEVLEQVKNNSDLAKSD